ncbi:putative galactarate dehydratase (L-threo-forming), partial [Dissostichus eleginoides]
CLSSTLRSFYLGSWYLKTSVSVPPQVSPPPPPPPPASDSTSAGERSPDGCHRWAFPSELPTTVQCVLGRVRSQASP